MPDRLSEIYSDILDGSYGCVDRIMLDAFSPMGGDPGAFRIWCRTLFGSDKDLDNAHFMRMADRFGRRVRAWAKAKGVPVVDWAPGQRKRSRFCRRSSTGVLRGVRRTLDEFPEIVRRLKEILERFLDSLYCLEACFVADSTLEDLPSPSSVGKTRVGGLDFNKPRTRLLIESVVSLSTAPNGFTASDLTNRTRELGGPSDYTSRQAAYDIPKLRA